MSLAALPRPERRLRRTRRDRLLFLTAIERLRGNTREANELTAAASSSSLKPRTPAPKPTSPASCSDILGPNFLRFKFVEGTRIRVDGNGHFYSDGGPAMTTALQLELDAINGFVDFTHRPLVQEPTVDLDAWREAAQAESGEEQADMANWYLARVGGYNAPKIEVDPAICQQFIDALNLLNSYQIVEIAEHVRETTIGQSIPPSPAPWDVFPPTPVMEPPQLGALPQGVNSPEFPFGLPSALQDGWEGLGADVTICENSSPNFQEKNSYHLFDVGAPNGNNAHAWHATAVMSVAVGSRNDRTVGGYPRYGTRGSAPLARRGYANVGDDWLAWWVPAIADATMHVAMRTGRAAIQSYSIGVNNSSVVGAQRLNWTPIEFDSSVYDAFQQSAARGQLNFYLSGNDGRDVGLSLRATGPRAFMVGGHNAAAPTPQPLFNFGNRVRITAMAAGVWVGSDDPVYGNLVSGSPVQGGQQYRINAMGTSFSTPLIAGSVAQWMGLFQQAFGRFPGDPGPGLYNVVNDLLTGPDAIGVTIQAPPPNTFPAREPDVAATAMERLLVTRFNPCSSGSILPPHSTDASVIIPNGVQVDSSLNILPVCAFAWPAPSGPFVRAIEEELDPTRGPLDLGHNPGDGFTLEARIAVYSPTADWQTIVAKENPRNYGLWITPIGHPTNAPGTLHFSYLPEGAGTFCPYYSSRVVADGAAHHVAVVYDGSGSFPTLRIFVDGVLDTFSGPCVPARPSVNGGLGANEVIIGQNMQGLSQIGDVRLYHYAVPDAVVQQHAVNPAP